MSAGWQREGLIQVPRQIEPPAPTTLDVHQLVACPTCRARVDQTCRTAGGNPTMPHASRLAPRLCSCGASLKPRKLYCEPCRAERRRETYALREQRAPTRQRRSKEAA